MDDLKKQVLESNLFLSEYGLAPFTWGNASGIDRESGLVVIKPSGVAYKEMTTEHMVVLDLETGETVEGELSPSSDTATHLALYWAFPNIGGVVHTHSRWATVFAQTGLSIPVLGTTHADYFYGEIPCTRLMDPMEISSDYEANTGAVIAERFSDLDYERVPAVLVHEHGPFAWGKDAFEAASNAGVLEEAAFMAWHTLMMCPGITPIQQEMLDRHYLRKNGPEAYYGQL
ncbi:MAG: L-ribulose-5-phosphate 4-epimerase AraD [Oscillospiraceae bacterium]|nr:L-ribulose-5-phosphate 4-epimerase AraD [Oscillospiraceae bacterium]